MIDHKLQYFTILKDWLTYGLKIWLLGWQVILKSLLGALIVSIFLVPFTFIKSILIYFGLLSTEVSVSLSSLIVAALFLLFYLPLAFYVAGSWIGFCKWIKNEDTEQDA